jgi:hypothetical protein
VPIDTPALGHPSRGEVATFFSSFFDSTYKQFYTRLNIKEVNDLGSKEGITPKLYLHSHFNIFTNIKHQTSKVLTFSPAPLIKIKGY